MAQAVTMRLLEQGEVLTRNGGDPVLADGGEVEVTVTLDGEETHKFMLDPVMASRLGGALRWIGRKGMNRRLRMEAGFWKNVWAEKVTNLLKRVGLK